MEKLQEETASHPIAVKKTRFFFRHPRTTQYIVNCSLYTIYLCLLHHRSVYILNFEPYYIGETRFSLLVGKTVYFKSILGDNKILLQIALSSHPLAPFTTCYVVPIKVE